MTESNTDSAMKEIMAELEELQSEMVRSTKSEVTAVDVPVVDVPVEIGIAAPIPIAAQVSASASEASSEDVLEQLEQDLLGSVSPSNEGSDEGKIVDLDDFRDQKNTVSMEETLESVKNQDAGAKVFQFDEIQKDEVKTVKRSDEEGSLTLKLSGNMTLKLEYEVEGQSVVIGFNDGALEVLLADGTEFKVPMRKKDSSSKAA